MMVLIAVLSAVLFFVYFPAFPDHDARVTGRPALLVCAALGMPCPSNPEFRASHSGHASATYILLDLVLDHSCTTRSQSQFTSRMLPQMLQLRAP
jgi:hypothetical protein